MIIFDLQGNIIANPGTIAVFGGFTSGDFSGYGNLDTAEFKKGEQGPFLYLRGVFFSLDQGLEQYATVIGRAHKIVYVSPDRTEAVADLQGQFYRPGIYDVGLIIRRPGDAAYDSTTGVQALKIGRR